MTLLRAAARTLLASVFVVNGVKAVRNPQALVPVAQPFTDRIVPLAKKYAPNQVAGSIPEDTATLVRIGGALEIVGGAALATGNGRRLGANLLALALIPKIVAANPLQRGLSAEEKSAKRTELLHNLGLLGGVLVASQDTEGKPSLAWRAQSGGERLTKQGRKVARQLTKDAQGAAADARKRAEQVRKDAAKQAKKTKKAINK